MKSALNTRSLVLLALGGLTLGLSACREVVVVNPGAPCRFVDREVCHRYRDYRGFWRRECRLERREVCARTMAAFGFEVSPVALADKFNISVDSAEQITDALIEAKAGKVGALEDLGLNKKDLTAISKLNMPAAESMDRVSRQLDMNADDAENMLASLISVRK